jgi:hypothetical protein
MRLLHRDKHGKFSFTKDLDGDDLIPPYAILSHTWGLDNEEVTFEDIIDCTGEDKLGYEKIRFCGEQASYNGLQYFWIDTCCTIQTHHKRQCPTKGVAPFLAAQHGWQYFPYAFRYFA